MLPELGIERIFRREIDALPIPKDELWVPARRERPAAIAIALVAGIGLVLALAALAAYGAAGGVASPDRSGVASSSPLRPTCLPGSGTTRGPCIAPVPIVVRSPDLGYNLWLPSGWHELGIGRGRPGLISHREFSARAPLDQLRAPSFGDIPWTLIVEVWQRDGRTAAERARADMCFAPANPGWCDLVTTSVRGEQAVSITLPWATSTPVTTRAVYIDRPQAILVLRFQIDSSVPPPDGVTAETFDQIVAMLGLS